MAKSNPLRDYLKVQQQADVVLKRALEKAARDIAARLRTLKPGVGGDIRKAQLNLVLKAIDSELKTLFRTGVADVIDGYGARAAQAAAEAAVTFDRVLTTALPEKAATALLDGVEATAREGIAADRARRARELSSRVFHTEAIAQGWVEETIRSGLISGLSARELALDVRKFISPTTPGGVSFAAMRLARTEINNAFHEQQIASADKPWVTGVKWNLSGSHPKPDDCNKFAEGNHANKGPGVYNSGDVPGKPHPQCLCYLTYETVSRDQFVRAYLAGKYDSVKAG